MLDFHEPMLGVFSLVIWCASLAVYVLCWIPSQHDVALRINDGPLFVMHVAVVLLAGMANSASGSDERGAKMTAPGFRAFYVRKPRFTWFVQLLVLALWVVSVVLLLWKNRVFSHDRVQFHDGHCFVQGVALDDATCTSIGVSTLRFFAGAWLAFGWLAVAQFVFARKDERFALDDVQ